jgi:hypothetical protein
MLLALWTTIDKSWLAVGIAVGISVFASLSALSRGRARAEIRSALDDNPALSATDPTTGLHAHQTLSDIEDRLKKIDAKYDFRLRAMYVEQHLTPLYNELDRLLSRLHRASPADYSEPKEWAAEYVKWREIMQLFWSNVNQIDPPGENPLNVSSERLLVIETVPETSLFETYEMQQHYRMLVIAGGVHESEKDKAMLRISQMARGALNRA